MTISTTMMNKFLNETSDEFDIDKAVIQQIIERYNILKKNKIKKKRKVNGWNLYVKNRMPLIDANPRDKFKIIGNEWKLADKEHWNTIARKQAEVEEKSEPEPEEKSEPEPEPEPEEQVETVEEQVETVEEQVEETEVPEPEPEETEEQDKTEETEDDDDLVFSDEEEFSDVEEQPIEEQPIEQPIFDTDAFDKIYNTRSKIVKKLKEMNLLATGKKLEVRDRLIEAEKLLSSQ